MRHHTCVFKQTCIPTCIAAKQIDQILRTGVSTETAHDFIDLAIVRTQDHFNERLQTTRRIRTACKWLNAFISLPSGRQHGTFLETPPVHVQTHRDQRDTTVG